MKDAPTASDEDRWTIVRRVDDPVRRPPREEVGRQERRNICEGESTQFEETFPRMRGSGEWKSSLLDLLKNLSIPVFTRMTAFVRGLRLLREV